MSENHGTLAPENPGRCLTFFNGLLKNGGRSGRTRNEKKKSPFFLMQKVNPHGGKWFGTIFRENGDGRFLDKKHGRHLEFIIKLIKKL